MKSFLKFSFVECNNILCQLAISFMGSGLAGLIVGAIFQITAKKTLNKALEKLQENLRSELSKPLLETTKTLSDEIPGGLKIISNRIDDLSTIIRKEISPIANSTNKISDDIDRLLERLER